MKLFFAFMFFVLFGSDIALCQEAVAVAGDAAGAGLGALLLPFLPVGAGETLAIVFAGLGAMNAVSMVMDKIVAQTETKSDDAVAAKFKTMVGSMQKFVNFFIAKR